jgi:hypothetical protein
VAQVEVDEVFGLVGNEGAEIAAYDAVPGRAFPLVELYGILLGRAASSRGEGQKGRRTVFLMNWAMSWVGY